MHVCITKIIHCSCSDLHALTRSSTDETCYTNNLSRTNSNCTPDHYHLFIVIFSFNTLIQAIQQRYKNSPGAVLTPSIKLCIHRISLLLYSYNSRNNSQMIFETAQKELLLEAFRILIQKTILLVAGYV